MFVGRLISKNHSERRRVLLERCVNYVILRFIDVDKEALIPCMDM